MGSSKKHKKHKSERREKYEEFSNNMDPAHLQQRGLKLILKVGSNSTPEYSDSSPAVPTAAEAQSSCPFLSCGDENDDVVSGAPADDGNLGGERERHKKSKKKKKKKDREKRHKHHHKEKRHHRSERKASDKHSSNMDFDDGGASTAAESATKDTRDDDAPSSVEQRSIDTNLPLSVPSPIVTPASVSTQQRSPKSVSTTAPAPDDDSSQDRFSFIEDDNSQQLPDHLLFYTGLTTENSPSCKPVTKPIVPQKPDEILLFDSPASSSVQSNSVGTSLVGSGNQDAAVSPTKPLPDLLIPSPSAHSTAASTPGGTSSLAALTPKIFDAPKTPSSSSESGREPRTCVLKMKQQKTSLNKLLDHILRSLEKRDPHQYFAWPVTDDIAPGYSSIISKPMDFSTMHQKIDENQYVSLIEFTDDFKLMCDNAIKYNRVDTVYNKAAKRLLQIGTKYLLPENLTRTLKPYLRNLTSKELGFEISQNELNSYETSTTVDSADEGASTGNEEPTQAQIEEEEKRRAIRLENEPKSKFEPYVDDLTSEEILAQVQKASSNARKRVAAKETAHKIGFLRQNKDGTTTLNLLTRDENEGPEKIVCLGDLLGKIPNASGTGQLKISREDKRNEIKLVKPLDYGAYASFAPVFDSRFSNLSKEETQLVMDVYGDATSTEYAESIMQFTKDSSYASSLARHLLDILTNGEHSKAMSDLYDMQVQNYEEQEVLKCFVNPSGNSAVCETREQIEEEYEKYKNTRIDFNRLRSLKDVGIDVSFLNEIEVEMKNFELTRRLQEHLSTNLNLIEKLRATQHDRLSQPLPQHLAHVPQPSQDEVSLAYQITQQLTDAAKKLPPSAIADPYSLRKAMGVSYVGLPPLNPSTPRVPVPDILNQNVQMPQINLPEETATPITTTPTTNANGAASGSGAATTNPSSAMDIDEDDDGVGSNSGVDLENELREFLESSGSGLHAANSADDSIVAQLLMN